MAAIAEQIIEKLPPERLIPEEELAEVIERKEEFVPLLIAEIERLTRAPEEPALGGHKVAITTSSPETCAHFTRALESECLNGLVS